MKFKFFILLIIPLLITGCYDYKEINDLAIVSAIGVSKKDDDYEITVQVINSQNHESAANTLSDFPNFFTYTASDKSIFKALKKISTLGSKKMYYNHFLLLLIDENIVKDNISEFFDVFLRETESRKEYNIFISKNNETNEILKTMTSLQTLNAMNILKSNEINSNSIGTTIERKFESMLKDYLNENKEVTLPTLILKNKNKDYDDTEILKQSQDEVIIENGPSAIFKKNKLIGYLDSKETMSLKILTNETNNIIYTYENDEGIISLELINIDNKIKFDKDKNCVTANINIEAILSEVSYDINLKKLSTIKKYNKILSESMKNDITDFIDNTKYKYKTDIVGIKDIIYKYENGFYQNIKNNYDEYYQNLNFDINVNFKIIEKGNATKEIKNE